MVHVGVGDENAQDGLAEDAGGGEDVVLGAGKAGVDPGKAVLLANELTVGLLATMEI